MADELPKTEDVYILRGPDRTVYMISDANLAQHRVSKELVPGLLKAFGPGDAEKAMGSFKIIATGKIPRRTSNMVPIDTWVDTM
jgi:hypothetical protein